MKLQQLRHRRRGGPNDAHLVLVRKVMAHDDSKCRIHLVSRKRHRAFANICIEALVHRLAAADDDVARQNLLSAIEQFR